MITKAAGRFITLEGGEGAGKSTQITLLATWLREFGIRVETTREPGGSPGAEAVRGILINGDANRWDPLAETLLHFAARRDHLARHVLPALESGVWVLCDRFNDSTVAYQGYGLGVSLESIAALQTVTLAGFEPDLTIVLDVSPSTRLTRLVKRGEASDRYERMDEAFHLRVRDGFRRIAAANPGRCRLIPGDDDKDHVTEAIKGAVRMAFDI